MPQGSTLGPLLFLIYINDLQYCLKYASSSHFADDTCLIYASKNPETLQTNLNYDLKNLTQWLYSNRLSLNIDKTKLLIFHSIYIYNKKNYDNIILKLQGVRLEHSNSVGQMESSRSYVTMFQKLQCYQYTMHFFTLI